MWISKKEYDELNAIKDNYTNSIRIKAPVCEAEKRFFSDCDKKRIGDLEKEIVYLKKYLDVSEKERFNLLYEKSKNEYSISAEKLDLARNSARTARKNQEVINDLNEAIKSCKVDLSFTCKEKPNPNPPDEIKLKNLNPVEIIESEFRNGWHYLTFKFKEK